MWAVRLPDPWIPRQHYETSGESRENYLLIDGEGNDLSVDYFEPEPESAIPTEEGWDSVR